MGLLNLVKEGWEDQEWFMWNTTQHVLQMQERLHAV